MSVDNLEQSNENLNYEKHINEDSTNLNHHNNVPNHFNEDTANLNNHDNVQNAANIEDVGIDEHLVPHLIFMILKIGEISTIKKGIF